MATTTQRVDWGRVIIQGLTAGIVGGILIDLYLWLTVVNPSHMQITAMWQWIASAAIGKAAFTSSIFIWMGLLIHFIVSIGWAGGYAYLASTRPYMSQRWPISGLMYGIVVYLFMQLILIGGGNFQLPPSLFAFVNAIVAHTVFFGLPVAFVVSRMDR